MSLTHPKYIQLRDIILKSEGKTIEDELVLEKSFTGFCDKQGEKIFYGDWLEFYHYDGAIWQGKVIYEDGVPTASILYKKNIKNPKGWNQKHEWIESRWWGALVGYGEFGSWDCARKSLIEIAGYFKTSEELFDVKKKFNKKYGEFHSNDHLQRAIPAKKVIKPKDIKDSDYRTKILSGIKEPITLDRILMALGRKYAISGDGSLLKETYQHCSCCEGHVEDLEILFELGKPLHEQPKETWDQLIKILS